MSIPEITEVEIRLNSPGQEHFDERVLGWASFIVGGYIKVNDALIIREQSGQLALKWPQLKSRRGRLYTVVHPLTKAFAQAVEQAVLGRLNHFSQPTGQSGLPEKYGPQHPSLKGE